jgi:hypothetical protein
MRLLTGWALESHRVETQMVAGVRRSGTGSSQFDAQGTEKGATDHDSPSENQQG